MAGTRTPTSADILRGSRIKKAREISGLTPADLATAIGISRQTLYGYEKGVSDPKSDGLIAISRVCNVTVDYLLGIVSEPNKDFVVTISDTDPQIDAILANAKKLNAQGLAKLEEYSDDLVSSGKYEKTSVKDKAM